MRTRLVGACIVSLTMIAGVAQAVPPLPLPVSDLISPGVLDALRSGDRIVDVIVTGPPHVGLDADHFASRAAAMVEVKTRSAPFFDAIRTVAAQTRSTIKEMWPAGPSLHMLATPAAIDRMSRMPEVWAIGHESPDAVKLIEPKTELDLGIQNTGGRQLIQAPEIHALGFRGEGIKLAIIDTGIWPGHEAFKFADGSSRIVAWRDFSTHNCATPCDGHGHGTHVAGTAAGARMFSDPTHGLFQEEGVAPRATLMGVKNLGDGGSGQWSWSLSALQWAYDNGADITSNSWGGSCGVDAIAVTRLVRQLTDLGMLSVIAAGNSGPSPSSIICPGRGESALTIGAVDQNKVIAGFSSRGPCTDPDLNTPSRICPDVVAKGVSVRSSWPRPLIASGYNTISGTSMATPHASGAAVLAEQMKRALTGSGWDTVARAEEALFKGTSQDLGAAGPDNTYGWGLVQLLAVRDLLLNLDIANIIPNFDISLPVIRSGGSTVLTFGVRNLGGAVATGPFKATLTDPNGVETTLRESTPSLGLLDAEEVVHTLNVTPEMPLGTYTFRGTFDYTWTDPNGGVHTGSVERSGTFVLKRVVLNQSLDGFPETALPLLPQALGFLTWNMGNEVASEVRIELSVPQKYLFLPGRNFTPSDMRTLYSDPAPDSVTMDNAAGTVVLTYIVGTLGVGDAFGFSSSIAPRSVSAVDGAFTITTKITYKDEIARPFVKTESATQVVQVVEVPAP